MKVTLIDYPNDNDLMLVKRAVWMTMGKNEAPKERVSPELLHKLLEARHSPIRLLNFTFLIEDIPSNISVHLCRHVHSVPIVQSLRNDRQDNFNGDEAPRNIPVNMIFSVNAEELMVIANKRLCSQASEMTRNVVRLMCLEALDVMPEFEGLLVPMCLYHGGVCHEIKPCGFCPKAGE